MLVVIGVFGVWLFNYTSVNRPLQHVLTTDPRNRVVSAQAYFSHWVNVDTLVFDLTSISANAKRMDGDPVEVETTISVVLASGA